MVFLLVFLVVYFGMNLYFFYKLKRFINSGWWLLYSLAILLTLSPILYRFYDRVGYENSYLSFSILLWMGFLVLFVFYHLLLDVYHGILRLSDKLLGHNPLPHIPVKLGFILVFILSFFSTVYGYYETLNLREYTFTIFSKKVDRDLKILHISDLHLNQVMREDKIKLILSIYNKEKPDIVISTGDLVDGNLKEKESYVHLLKQIDPPLGKYAILGNHEYYNGVEQAIEFTQRSGFMLLRDEYIYLPNNLVIVGVDDDEAIRFGVFRKKEDISLLQGIDRSRFVVFLKHQPRIDRDIFRMFDLALCGHTHGGVFYPIRYILKRMFITDAGLVKYGNSYLFVSRGVGTGGPPMRIGAPPDVAVFSIKRLP